jgi:hypothetical protein
MRNIILLLWIVFFTGCEKYIMNNSTVTLSGKYVVSKLEVTYVDQNTGRDSLYTLGSTYINRNASPPFDSIRVNGFKIHMDYASIRMNQIGVTQTGRDIWEYGNSPNEIFYYIWNNTGYDLGYLQFDYITRSDYSQRVTFHIEHDGAESLQLKSVGEWPFGKFGPKRVITMYLTRIGP